MSTITKKKKLVPELRFSGFSGEWNKTRIQKLIDEKSITSHLDGNHGALYPKSSEFTEAGIPYVTANDFKNGYVNLENSKRLPLHRAKQFKKGVSKSGDVLFAHNATVGPAAVLETDLNYVVLSTTATYFRFDSEKINNHFFKYTLLSQNFINQYTRVMSQSTRDQVPITTQRKFVVSLPPILEQQKIADFLGSVDAWLDNLHGQKTALQSYKQGMMQKLFTGQVRFKDENGRNFPEWQEVSMSDIGDSFGGLSGKSGDDFGQGESFITYKQIFDDSVIEPKKFAKVTVAPGEKQNRAQKGDVFFTVSSETPNEVGYASVLMEDVNPYLNSFAFGFRPKSLTDLLPEYSRYHFRSAPFRRQVVRLAQGSTRYNISKVQFMKLIIEIPSASEQQKIADFLTALDQTITTKAEEITRVEKWKKGLMQKMFV